MKKCFPILVLSMMTALAAPARAEDVVLKYHVTSDKEVTEINANQVSMKHVMTTTTPYKTEYDATVTLLPTQFGIRKGDEEDIYDFTAKKIYEIDHAKKTWKVVPIYSVPLERHQKLERMAKRAVEFERASGTGHLVKTISGMVVDTKGIDLDLDMLYASIGDVKTTGELKLVHHTTQKSFETPDGAEIAKFEQSEQLMSQELLKSYNNFLVYIPSLHPDIEKQMSVSSKPFKSLETHTNDHNGTTVVEKWEMQDVQANKGAVLDPMPKDYTGIYSEDEALNLAFNSAQKPGPKAADYGKRVSDYIKQGDGMRAMLVMNELSMSLPVEESRTQEKLSYSLLQLTDDQLVKETMTAVTQRQSTKDGIGHTNQTLMAAKKAYPDYVYFLDIFRANNIRTAIANDIAAGLPFDQKSFIKALKMYSNALIENPWLATAYAELGDANHDFGDEGFAWVCWEQATRLKPDLSTKLRVDKLKESIEKDYPEYF